MSDHTALKTWAILVIGSMAFSALIFTVDPFGGGMITGYSIYDSGPDVELNPDFVGNEEYYSNIFVGASLMFLLLVIQIGVYLGISKYYTDLDD